MAVPRHGDTPDKINNSCRTRADRLSAKLRECEESLISNVPVPVTLTVTSFECLDQSDEIRILFGFNTEDDEPYATVFAVDLKIVNLAVASVPAGVLNSKMSLVGPLADVVKGDDVSAPANVVWGLSGARC